MPDTPPCRRLRLGNGLRLLQVPAPGAGLVAVHLAYRVGAADEPEDARGLAHLSEHLMYAGSRALPGSHLRHLDAVGASDLNGRTGLDSTHYFQTVPLAALEFALHAEAARMAAPLLRARDFVLQRRVVIEELRQRRAQAEQRVAEHWQACLYPAPHPYHRGSGGDAQQLTALSLTTLRYWQQRYYQPGNAVLALAGDLSFAQARQLAQRYFGQLPAAPCCAPAPLPLRSTAPPPFRLQEALPAPRRYQAWRLPPALARAQHEAFCWLRQLLAQRLQARRPATAELLVHFDALRLGAALSLELRGASAPHQVWLSAQWQQLLAQGFSKDEWRQAGAELARQRQLRRESLQGLAAQAVEAELQRGDARLAFSQPAGAPDADALLALLRSCASCAPLQLDVLPAAPVSRRSKPLPAARASSRKAARETPAPLPGEHRLDAWLATRRGSGLIAGSLLLPAGARHERAAEAGLAALSARLFAADEVLRASAEAWQLRIDAQRESTQLRWCCRSEEMPVLLRRLAQALQQQQITEAMFAAQRQRQHEALQAQHADIVARTQQLLGRLLWKAPPLLGTPATLAQLDLAALQAFRAQQYRPGGAQLLLAGDPGRLQLDAELAACLAPWSGTAAAPQKSAAALRKSIAHCEAVPGARAVLLTMAWPLPPPTPQGEAVQQLADQLLAGSFASRLNLRLREQLGWTYGLRSAAQGEAAQRHYQIQCWLPADRALAAVEEVRVALRWLAEAVSAAQLRRARDRLWWSAAGRVERSEQLLDALQRHVRLGFDEVQWRRQHQVLAEVSLSQMRQRAEQLLNQPSLCLLVGEVLPLHRLLS
ncbi:Predicted Zn-dependent peptidase [Solimonas aquatica]|uniref:Predicted Zn-dependent peptidase n=1 Tax=Solimonas aquatica TaxID=489703 RepID=A0A1H9GNR4_9GAMM|nr:insulinase family protein [Solimonas aquatica]SEQ51643.1 Predicted Zn-dependent peptidase [Solimonas aquatica]